MKRFAHFAVSALFVFACACGGSSKKAAEPTPVAPEAAPAAETPAVAGAGDGKLTEAQCTASLDHAIELFKADAQMAEMVPKLEEQKATFVQQCLEKGEQKDYDCLMAAKTVQELGQCEEP